MKALALIPRPLDFLHESARLPRLLPYRRQKKGTLVWAIVSCALVTGGETAAAQSSSVVQAKSSDQRNLGASKQEAKAQQKLSKKRNPSNPRALVPNPENSDRSKNPEREKTKPPSVDSTLRVPQESKDYSVAAGETVMGLQNLGEIEVKGRANDLQGIAASASQGQVSNDDFKYRPIARTGELIEVVPGMISTQHSGTGKANQYFLRGFNLDHGTDFTTWIDGIPMNLRTNAHGQGYMDLNSMIPELIDTIEFGKGPYYADQGDFSSAGYARMLTKNRMTGFNNDGTQGYAKFEGGQFDYYRGLFANSNRLGEGDLLYAFEYSGFMGPWVVPENSNKYNGLLKYTFEVDDWQVSLNAKSYYSHWIATNQIPMMQLGESLTPTCCNVPGMNGVGADGRFGSMNPSDGGITSRYSGSVNAKTQDRFSATELNVYALYYDLDLYSDFSYFQANPYQGDQIRQQEHRVQAGGNAEQTWFHTLQGLDMEEKLGVQLRYDGIRNLGVSNTFFRRPVQNNSYLPPSLYNVDETSLWFYAQNETRWTSWFRSVTSARSDTFWFDVQSIQPGFAYNAQNSGSTSATVLSPKFNLVFGPWEKTELFINSGYSYHSNDARGTVIQYNPDGSKADPVSPLSWSRGAETGVRTQFLPGLNTTLAVWFLQMSDELVFVGDAGKTESTGATTRLGVEWTNFYKPTDWLTFDADFAFTQSRYREATDPGCEAPSINVPGDGCLPGYSVPNAVGMVITTGVQVDLPQGFYGALRLRTFGQDPINNNATAWLGTTNLLNLQTGWHNTHVKVDVEVFNLLDAQANDIAYWYQYGICNTFSTGQCGGADQVTQWNATTFHPVLPRMVRAGITVNF